MSSDPAHVAASTCPTAAVGDYIRLRRIGAGTYGDVWLARDAVGKLVALKVIDRERLRLMSRTNREERALRLLRTQLPEHPRLIRVFHVGNDEPYLYYTMELADNAVGDAGTMGDAPQTPLPAGRRIARDTGVPRAASDQRGPLDSEELSQYRPMTLSDAVRPGSPMPIGEAIAVIRQLLDAVRCLHDHGIVHRDIKPANVLRVGSAWKLADIGLMAEETTAMTTVGTPDFMPPTGKIDRGADLYGLGKVLYCLVTGSSPREFPSIPTRLLTPNRRHGFAAVNDVITQACDVRPDRRFQAADEFEAALVACEQRITRGPRRWRIAYAGVATAAVIMTAALGGWWGLQSDGGVTGRSHLVDDTGWIGLFNGADLSGWHKVRPNHGTWYVEDGVIWCEPGEEFKTLQSDTVFGPGTLRVTVIPGHDGARIGVGYLHDDETRGPLFMFMGKNYTWIRGYRDEYPPNEPGNWLTFPGPDLSPDEPAEFEVEYGPTNAIVRVNGVELQQLPGIDGTGHIALHVWSDDAGGFAHVSFLPGGPSGQ